MTIDEMIAVLQAAKAGKPVQARIDSVWQDVDKPQWDFGSFHYRVKPQPREFWINVYKEEYFVSTTLDQANINARADRIECIHVIEVTD